MATDKVNNLLSEIVNSQGFINIDQNDVDIFKTNVDEIDAERVFGKVEEIGVILDSTISSIIKRIGDKQIKKLLFVIRLPQENNFMEHISNVHDVIDKLDEKLECQWGLATIDSLQGNQLEIIVAIGI